MTQDHMVSKKKSWDFEPSQCWPDSHSLLAPSRKGAEVITVSVGLGLTSTHGAGGKMTKPQRSAFVSSLLRAPGSALEALPGSVLELCPGSILEVLGSFLEAPPDSVLEVPPGSVVVPSEATGRSH